MNRHEPKKLPAVAACILHVFDKGAHETPSTLSTFKNKGGGVNVRVKLLHVRSISNGKKRVTLNCFGYPSNVARGF